MILAIVLFVCFCMIILSIIIPWRDLRRRSMRSDRDGTGSRMIDYPGILRQMGDVPPHDAIDLTGMLPMETFQTIGDRLRAEGKLRPFRDIALLYDEEGALLGKVERQSDQTWAGAILFQGTWYPVHRDADGAPLIVERDEKEREQSDDE